MTITVAPARNEYTANAGQTIFNFTFKIFSETDLNVYITPSGQDANDSTDITTSYSVPASSIGDPAGGSITLATPTSLGDLVTIVSNVPSSRTTDYQNNGDFRPDTVNDDFDRVVSIAKKIEDLSNRTVVLQQSQQDPKPLSLPTPKAGLGVRWNGGETGLENYDISTVSNEEIASDKVVINYPTLLAAQNSSDLKLNQACNIAGRNTKNDAGGAMWDAVLSTEVTVNGFNIVQCTGVPTLALVLRIENCIYNVAAWGAIDGAADNTAPMQAAATAAGDNGGVYFLPKGLWIHDQIDLKSNTIMMGCGYESRDQRLSDLTNPITTRVGYRMFNTDVTPPYNPSLNAANLTCHQIHFLGTVATDGFQEFKHLIMTQGVTNLDIQTCWFTGWQGDALVIRSGNNTAAARNFNVKVKDCIFDGVNNDNRNAISITDVYGMTIRDNTFMNCTRSNMPGAIDIEPNTLDTFVILNDIYIGHNNLRNIGGNVAAIGMTMPVATEAFDTHPPRNMTVENNVIEGCFTGLRFSQVQTVAVTNAFAPLNVKMINNAVFDATERSFWLFGVRGVDMAYNHFERCAKAGAIGWVATEENCDEISLFRNYFRHCGTTDGSAIAIYKSSHLDFVGNTFDNVGVTGGGFGVLFSFTGGASSEVRIEGNTIINNQGLATGIFSFSGGGSVISGSNTLKSNNFLSFDTSLFPANFTNYGETSSETGITAAAGGQAGAFQLTNAMNVVSTASAFDGVKLPKASGDGRVITINNTTAVSIQTFPFSGDNLGQGTNAPESLAAGNSKSYRTYDGNNWIKTTF